jgi:hypothetical protein
LCWNGKCCLVNNDAHLSASDGVQLRASAWSSEWQRVERRGDGSMDRPRATGRLRATGRIRATATGRSLSEKRATCSGVSYAGRGSSVVRGRLCEAALVACAMDSRRAKRRREG